MTSQPGRSPLGPPEPAVDTGATLAAYGVDVDRLDPATAARLAEGFAEVRRALAGEPVEGVRVGLERTGTIVVRARVDHDGAQLEVTSTLDLASGQVSRDLRYRHGDTTLDHHAPPPPPAPPAPGAPGQPS